MTDENTLRTDSVVEAAKALLEYADLMPKETPAPGAASTVHQFGITAGAIWTLAERADRLRKALAEQPRDDVREHPCWSETLGRNAHRSYVHDGDMRCERCDAPLNKDKSERIDTALAPATQPCPKCKGRRIIFRNPGIHGGCPAPCPDCCTHPDTQGTDSGLAEYHHEPDGANSHCFYGRLYRGDEIVAFIDEEEWQRLRALAEGAGK